LLDRQCSGSRQKEKDKQEKQQQKPPPAGNPAGNPAEQERSPNARLSRPNSTTPNNRGTQHDGLDQASGLKRPNLRWKKPPVIKPPPPVLKEVKKSNNETDAWLRRLREREDEVDQKTGIKQTQHIAPTGRVERKEVEDKNGTKQITNYDLGRRRERKLYIKMAQGNHGRSLQSGWKERPGKPSL